MDPVKSSSLDASASLSSTLLSALRAWWLEHHGWLLRAAVAILAVFALLKLGSEFWRLVWDSSRIAAIDLKFRHIEVQRWFAGLPVYSYRHGAVYPPATYAMLWPLVGWLNFTAARWVWAASSVVMLAWLTWLIASRIGADAPVERAFVALLLLSMNATGVAIGNGQLIVHCLCLLLTGLLVVVAIGIDDDVGGLDGAVGDALCFQPVKDSLHVFGVRVEGLGRRRPVVLHGDLDGRLVGRRGHLAGAHDDDGVDEMVGSVHGLRSFPSTAGTRPTLCPSGHQVKPVQGR